MKKLLLLPALFLINMTFAQDVMDKITTETCECIKAKKIDIESSNKSELEMQLGLCMMQAYGENKDKLPKNKRLDLSNDKQMEGFGMEIGLKMIKFCPDILMAIGAEEEEISNEEEEYDQEVDEPLKVSGTFTGSKIDGFFVISVKEETGKINNFILLDKFDASYLITDKVLKINEKIDIEYYETELFNTKTNEFNSYKIITDIIKESSEQIKK